MCKRRIFVSVCLRDELSISQNRSQFSTSAYLWGIFIRPKYPRGHGTHAFDITDGPYFDGETMANLNPNQEWYFRSTADVNPATNIHVLGGILVGKITDEVKIEQIENILRPVPLPVKGEIPEQTCVTWIKAAIRALQDANLVRDFDVNNFMVYALRFADKRMKEGVPEYVTYKE